MKKYYINWNDSEFSGMIKIDKETNIDEITKMGLFQYLEEITNDYIEDCDEPTDDELQQEIEITIYEGIRVYPNVNISVMIEDLVEDLYCSNADTESDRIEAEIYGATLRNVGKEFKNKNADYWKFRREKEKPILKDLQEAIKEVFKKHDVDMSIEELQFVKKYSYTIREIMEIVEV